MSDDNKQPDAEPYRFTISKGTGNFITWNMAPPPPPPGTVGMSLRVYGDCEQYNLPYAVMAAAAVEQTFSLAERLDKAEPQLARRLREMARRGLDELRANLMDPKGQSR